MTWGVESDVAERFTEAGVPSESITFVRDTYWFNFPVPPADVMGVFRTYYGPTMNAFAAAEESGRTADLAVELVALFEEQNESTDEGTTSIPATFLRVAVAV